MKPRYLIVCVLLAANANIRAGELSVIGNVNVASNLTAAALTLGGESNNSFTYTGGDFQLRRDGSSGHYTVLELTGHQGSGPYSVASLTLNARDASEQITGGAQMCVGNDGHFHIWSDMGANNCFDVDLVQGNARVVADQGAGNFSVDGDLSVDGKSSFNGGVDPPYLLLDSETRSSIANRVAREVPPSKQTGAALFWNAQAKQLEIYVASEGAFYGLNGKMLAAISPPAVDGARVLTSYRIDTATGTILSQESLQTPKWRLKRGYQFNRLTGEFTKVGTSNAPPVAVSAQEALELK
jgi:hypothetical protein